MSEPRIVGGAPVVYFGGELLPIESGSFRYSLDGDECARETVWSGDVVLRYVCVLAPGHDGEHRWEPEA